MAENSGEEKQDAEKDELRNMVISLRDSAQKLITEAVERDDSVFQYMFGTVGDLERAIVQSKKLVPPSEKTETPEYLVRSDDFMIFSLNKDGKTYSIMDHKAQWPKNHHHEYPKEALLNCGFFVGIEADFPTYKKKQNKYYKDLAKGGDKT